MAYMPLPPKEEKIRSNDYFANGSDFSSFEPNIQFPDILTA